MLKGLEGEGGTEQIECEGGGSGGVKFLMSEGSGFLWKLGRGLWLGRFWGVAIFSWDMCVMISWGFTI